MKRVINFSGGKTSALMTILLKPTPDDLVIFCDTGREHPKTYKFINDFEANEGIEVHRITYEHPKSPGLTGFEALNRRKVYLPNRAHRICTIELKVLTLRRYLKKLGIKKFEQYIGFRFDEARRVDNFKSTSKSVTTFFPLYEMKVTKEMVNQYWLTKPYTLEIPSILGNCDLCFLKGKSTIIRILQMYPELADKWIEDEREMSARKRNGVAQYFPDISYEQLLHIAKTQKGLFDNLEGLTSAYSCACTT